MTPADYIVEGALIGAGLTLLALRLIRDIRQQLARIVEKRFERNERQRDLDERAQERLDALKARNTIKIEARGDRLHTYACKCCGRQVVGLDYYLPAGWQPGYMLGEPLAVEYACSQSCLDRLADGAGARS